jgi:uncharacterized protein YdiU (UPF0061 family)
MRTHIAGGWCFDNTYVKLPPQFFVHQAPRTVARPRLLLLNYPLARELGLDPEWLKSKDGVNMLAGNAVVSGSDPIAQAYAGHQFGHFTMLGDGRAILMGEHITPGGQRFDIQLKGAGRTVFSRGGDGLAAVGPMVREYLISEAMAALGIPTTRSLAVIGTGEKVVRESVLYGAVLTRVASSHIRVGTFEYASAINDTAALRELLLYTMRRHYPEIPENSGGALALLERVIKRQANLVAGWMLSGFVHGVMNTDNMTLSGETIDYGPCAFIDTFDPATVFSSIDHGGRYAFGNQPTVAQWNLGRLAEALLPMIAKNEDEAVLLAQNVIDQFPQIFKQAWLEGMLKKLGLVEERPGDDSFVESLLDIMHKNKLDYTATFRMLSTAVSADVHVEPEPLEQWRCRWLERVDKQNVGHEETAKLCAGSNPAVIPRNHLVEEALSSIITDDNYGPLNKLIGVLSRPFESNESTRYYERPPEHVNPDYRTFCGT